MYAEPHASAHSRLGSAQNAATANCRASGHIGCNAKRGHAAQDGLGDADASSPLTRFAMCRVSTVIDANLRAEAHNLLPGATCAEGVYANLALLRPSSLLNIDIDDEMRPLSERSRRYSYGALPADTYAPTEQNTAQIMLMLS